MNATLLRERNDRMQAAVDRYHACYRNDVYRHMVSSVAIAYGVSVEEVETPRTEAWLFVESVIAVAEHTTGLVESAPYKRMVQGLVAHPFATHATFAFLSLFGGQS